jgi:membrane protein DedA with SNARE-associated domain
MLAAQPTLVGLAGLSGYALIAVVCALLIVEEVGIPLPFAPGDLLLVVSGAAIPTANLDPLIVVAATTLSVLVGALAGREIFARLGTVVVWRVASLLRVGAGLDLLAARVRRGGAPAVFLGRLTPGLRVHTTEAAGLVRMRRLTFLAGLLPAMAVYEAIFLGLGAWQGPSAWAMIQAHTPPPVVVLAAVGAVVLLLVGVPLVRSLRRRGPRRRTDPTAGEAPDVAA